MTTKHHDIPYVDILRRCRDLQARGCVTYVKFTCSACGERRTYPRANVFPKTATCPVCHQRTDIEVQGGGFLLAIPADSPEEARAIRDRLVAGARADGVEARVESVSLVGQTLGQAVARLVGASGEGQR